MGRKIKVGTKVQILFRPLKKVFLKRGWGYLYKQLLAAKGNKKKLILFVDTIPSKGEHFERERYNKEDGKYYNISFFSCGTGQDDSCRIPTSCFRVIGDKKK
jgi:hypothetical protein